jgi:hypothetical protein
MAARFNQRVNRATQRLAGRFRGRDLFDGKFDTCFEAHDGDCVVAALIRRAQTDVALRLGIRLRGSWRDGVSPHISRRCGASGRLNGKV